MVAWSDPAEGRQVDGVGQVDWDQSDHSTKSPFEQHVMYNAFMEMDSGLTVAAFGLSAFDPSPNAIYGALDRPIAKGVHVWTDSTLIKWEGAEIEVWAGGGADGGRRVLQPQTFPPFPEHPASLGPELIYQSGSIRSMLAAIGTARTPFVTGHDIRQALEVATAVHQSASRGSTRLTLPLVDRVADPLFPRQYRWSGGDEPGAATEHSRAHTQNILEAVGMPDAAREAERIARL